MKKKETKETKLIRVDKDVWTKLSNESTKQEKSMGEIVKQLLK